MEYESRTLTFFQVLSFSLFLTFCLSPSLARAELTFAHHILLAASLFSVSLSLPLSHALTHPPVHTHTGACQRTLASQLRRPQVKILKSQLPTPMTTGNDYEADI